MMAAQGRLLSHLEEFGASHMFKSIAAGDPCGAVYMRDPCDRDKISSFLCALGRLGYAGTFYVVADNPEQYRHSLTLQPEWAKEGWTLGKTKRANMVVYARKDEAVVFFFHKYANDFLGAEPEQGTAFLVVDHQFSFRMNIHPRLRSSKIPIFYLTR